MDNKSVPHGIFTFPTFNKKLTIDIYAIKIIMSVLTPCTTVNALAAPANILHTKTIAVYGAAPSKTAPAKYSDANSSLINPVYIIKKNKDEIKYIVSGLIIQFTNLVINRPLGF